MMRRTAFAVLGFAILAISAAACGRQAETLPSTSESSVALPATWVEIGAAKSGKTPPPSIVEITPAPGYPTAPPLHVALVPATPYPASKATPRVLPLPTAIGGTQVGGSKVSSSVATALAAVLPTPEPNTVVYGKLAGYAGTKLIVATSPFISKDPDGSAASGIARVKLPKVPATLTVSLDGKTIDAIPGGYRSLHTGDAILVVVNLSQAAKPPALYVTDLDVLGKNARRAAVPSLRNAPIVTLSRAPQALRRRADAILGPLAASPVSFTLQGKTEPYAQAVVSPALPALPSPIVLPFATIDVQYEVAASYGESTNYPLQLEDVSDKYPWQLDVESILPIAVLNGTASDHTFIADGTATVAFSVKVTYRSNANGNAIGSSGEFLLSQSSDGNDGEPAISFQSTSDSKLLAPKATATLTPSQKGEYTFDIAPSLEQLIETLDPSSSGGLSNNPKAIPIQVEQYIDGTITGGSLSSKIEVTNADPTENGVEIFDVDNIPLGIAPGDGYPWKPTGSPNKITLNDPGDNFKIYSGKTKFTYESTVTSPLGKIGPTQLDGFDALPDGDNGFTVAKYSPPPTIDVTPAQGSTSVCADDTNSANSDGGGSCGYSNGNSGVVLDIVRSSPATYSISDTSAGGRTKKVKFTVNPNDPPPQSLSGVPPYVCSSTNVTISPPLTGTKNPWTLKVTVPPENQVPKGGCGFSISDNYGAKVYVSLTDDIPSS